MQRSFVFVYLLVVCLFCLGPLAAQDSGLPMLTPVENNPVLAAEPSLEWEAGGSFGAAVVPYDDQWVMFYLGTPAHSSLWSAGYATSDDGVTWTRYEGNPVFTPDLEIAPYGIGFMTVFYDGAQWIMLFTPSMSRVDVLAATAAAPEGPWIVADEPALPKSSVRDWDAGPRFLSPVIKVGDEYTMYFSSNGRIGMATSPDGLHWIRYDDPATTSRVFSVSDPVLTPNRDSTAWDRVDAIYPLVRQTEDGWEMFYSGDGETNPSGAMANIAIGYASSPDGIQWIRQGDGPILTNPEMAWLLPVGISEGEDVSLLYYWSAGAYDNSLPWTTDAAVITYP